MNLEGTIHCEAPECDIHQHVGSATVEAGRLPVGWVVVRFFEDNGQVVEHGFCNGDCALKWLGAFTSPPEVIDAPF